MNKHRFPFLAFFILVALGITEGALIASPEDAAIVDDAPVGPLRAHAYPDRGDEPRAALRGEGFSVPLPAGFTGAALASGDVVMSSRDARVDVRRVPAQRAHECAARADANANAVMVHTEAWRADGEGGCRAWMSLPSHHVIEASVNRGAHAYVVTCASKDAQLVQDVCAPMIGGLRIVSDAHPSQS